MAKKMKYVAYYRVSTKKQGQSGLGLDAQRTTVARFLDSRGAVVLDEFTEVESGKNNERPEFKKARRRCLLTGATLLIAKLDRLSRDAKFILELQSSEINFICADMPEANNLTIQLLAVLAQHERELISVRTRDGLAEAKARGTVLGNPRLQEVRNNDNTAANAVRVAKAKQRNQGIAEVIDEMLAEHGDMTPTQIAAALDKAGYRTSRGCTFSRTQVYRALATQAAA